MIFWVIATVALLAGVAMVVYFRAFHKPEQAPQDTATKVPDYNLAYDPPASPWERDRAMEAKLGLPIIMAFKRTSPEAYLAIGAKDFKDRNPRPSELRAGLDDPLNRLFQGDTIKKRPMDAPGSWLGQPAPLAFDLRAQKIVDGSSIQGICYALHAKGIAYWLIAWAGETEYGSVAEDFDAIRSRFRLLALRDQWNESAPTVTSFTGRAIEYRLQDGEGIWTEQKDAEQQLPPADLHLVGRVKRRGADFSPEAELWVYILDAGGEDPLKQALAFVEDAREADLAGRAAEFRLLKDEPEGDPVYDTVATPTPVMRVECLVSASREQNRLIVVSAIKQGNKVVVVRAQCELIHRDVFETKLIQIAGSLQMMN